MMDFNTDPMALAAHNFAMYGTTPVAQPTDEERWVQSWRSATANGESFALVSTYQSTAEAALESSLLSEEERSILRLELLNLPSLNPQQISFEEIVDFSTPAFPPYPSALPSSSLLSISERSGESSTPPSSSPATAPAEPKKKRGRKPGSKDNQPRAERGSLAHLSKAEKSKRARDAAKQRKQQAQQQQQQAQ